MKEKTKRIKFILINNNIKKKHAQNVGLFRSNIFAHRIKIWPQNSSSRELTELGVLAKLVPKDYFLLWFKSILVQVCQITVLILKFQSILLLVYVLF